MNRNEGIVVSGGSISSNQLAVGRNAQAVQNTYNLAGRLENDGEGEVARAITELVNALESSDAAMSFKEEAIEITQEVTKEVSKENPNKFTLKGMLSSIKEVVSPTAELVEKVAVLQKAIALMMGFPTM